MFKVLLLQRWYGLSNPAIGAVFRDCLSFMAFSRFRFGFDVTLA